MGSREAGTYAPKRSRIADKRETSEANAGRMYVLNKAIKNEIIHYAQNVSNGVTRLRAATRQTAKDMESFNRNIRKDGFNAARNYLDEDLYEFTERYNSAADFMQNQTQSAELRTFSHEISDNLAYHKDRIAQLGLSTDENSRLNYDRAFFGALNQDDITSAIRENAPVFAGLQRHAGNFLTEPLVAHMHFKGLGYHYNYAMGKMEADGFNMLEAGMLIDKAV
jgi:hypothetical protein